MSRHFGALRQLGYVVTDIEAAMDYWGRTLGVGPWFYNPRVPIVNYQYRGQVTVPVRLTAGTHSLSLRTSADGGATALPGSDLSLDKFDLAEVTGAESARYPAVLSRRYGATTVAGLWDW